MSTTGKAAFLKQLRKSVMGRLRPLNQDERLDVVELVNQGIPLAQARAIAQGYAGVRKDADSKSALMDELETLRARIKVILAEIGKSSPLASEVHVQAPLGGGKRKDYVIKRQGAHIGASELAFIQAAYDQSAPIDPRATDDGRVPPEAEPLMRANRLVQGMDFEMRTAQDPETARRRASRVLQARPGEYVGVGRPPALAQVRGLMLDVCCGPNRLEGHLGLDVFAHDYGTVLHDVSLGLPFPDGCVAHINVAHAWEEIAPFATAFLLECQRVLVDGGQVMLTGDGPMAQAQDGYVLPGLILASHDEAQGVCQQVLQRAPARVPSFHGADATFNAAPELPIDLQMALAAYNDAPAQWAMANLVHKAQGHVARIAKADGMRQIVTGVVLGPDVEDTQGDVMSAEDIEQAAHNYLKQSRVIGSEHGRPVDANVVESYIAPQDLTFDGPEGPEVVTAGSWVMSVHITDKQVWDDLMSGGYTGFSVGGLGTRVEAA